MANQIVEYKKEIKAEVLANKEVFNALAQNTFKGLTEKNIPQAILQGMMKGFELKDFMVGNVYALPFWNKKEQRQEFSLVNSIDHARKKAMKAGQSGKSKPTFVYDQDDVKKIDSCEVTVWKQGGDDRGYTALVFFDEYNTGKNLWVSKPKTMISKVAEMHALRMAFPDELQNIYVEEEFEKDRIIDVDIDDPTGDEEFEHEKAEVIKHIKGFKKLDELKEFFTNLDTHFIKAEEVVNAYKETKEKLEKPAKATKK